MSIFTQNSPFAQSITSRDSQLFGSQRQQNSTGSSPSAGIGMQQHASQQAPLLGQSVQGIFTVTGPATTSQYGQPGSQFAVGDASISNSIYNGSPFDSQSAITGRQISPQGSLFLSPNSIRTSPSSFATAPTANLSPILNRSMRQSFRGSLGSGKEKKVIPSHLSQYSPGQSSHGDVNSLRTQMQSVERSGNKGTPVTSSSHPFGGASFGTPKPSSRRAAGAEVDNRPSHSVSTRNLIASNQEDVPPVLSIYESPQSRNDFYDGSNLRMPVRTSQSFNSLSNITGNENTTESMKSSLRSQPSDQLDAVNESSQETQSDDAKVVLVFGFPSNLYAAVVDIFSKLGTVSIYSPASSNVDRRCLSSGENMQNSVPNNVKYAAIYGNWVRLRFSDATSAARAVAMNGTLLGGKYIIGCIYASTASSEIANIAETEEKEPSQQNLPQELGHEFGHDPMEVDNSPLRVPTKDIQQDDFPSPMIGAFQSPQKSTKSTKSMRPTQLSRPQSSAGHRIEAIENANILSSPQKDSTFGWVGSLFSPMKSSTSGALGLSQSSGLNSNQTSASSLSWYSNTVKKVVEAVFGF